MKEHSKEHQEASNDLSINLTQSMLQDLDAQSMLMLWVDRQGDHRFNVAWDKDSATAIESIAEIFVEMIAGSMGEEILEKIKYMCVSNGDNDLYDNLMAYFSSLSSDLVSQHNEEVQIDQNEIVVPPDQTFTL